MCRDLYQVLRCFLQALQVALSVKRVKGDPVKGNYQDHDKFMLKVYAACRRFRFSKFIQSLTAEDLEQDRQLQSVTALLSVEERMTTFYKSWETSHHQPSRLIALFLKDSASYLRCKEGIRKNNYWLLEKESCDWMGA